MTDLADQMAAESENQKKTLTEDSLKTVSLLAQEQLRLEGEIETLTKKLSTLKEEHRVISETKLPDTLAEYGLSEVRLKDGKKIVVKEIVSAEIKKDNEEKAFAWLRENGFGDLIKRVISTSFGKGEDKVADALSQQLAKKGLNVADKASVHAQTLKAFVREQIEAGNAALPKDIFGVYEGKKATITLK